MTATVYNEYRQRLVALSAEDLIARYAELRSMTGKNWGGRNKGETYPSCNVVHYAGRGEAVAIQQIVTTTGIADWQQASELYNERNILESLFGGDSPLRQWCAAQISTGYDWQRQFWVNNMLDAVRSNGRLLTDAEVATIIAVDPLENFK